MRHVLIFTTALASVASGAALAQQLYGLRGPTPLAEEPQPPPLARELNDDQRQARNWPEQPPVIPHTIQGYQITLNANKCLTCHGRQFTAQSQAPMISITHFMAVTCRPWPRSRPAATSAPSAMFLRPMRSR